MPQAPRAWVAVGRTPALVLGRSQHALHPATDLRVRRRASGGGAVLIGPSVLRSLLRLPLTHAAARAGPSSLARWAGDVHLRWLASLGVEEAALHEGRATNHWACFLGLGPGEVIVRERKLLGIAQAWHRGTAWVWSATLLQQPPWSRMCDALGQPEAAALLARQTVSLQECLGAPADPLACESSLRAALHRALSEGAGPTGA